MIMIMLTHMHRDGGGVGTSGPKVPKAIKEFGYREANIYGM